LQKTAECRKNPHSPTPIKGPLESGSASRGEGVNAGKFAQDKSAMDKGGGGAPERPGKADQQSSNVVCNGPWERGKKRVKMESGRRAYTQRSHCNKKPSERE